MNDQEVIDVVDAVAEPKVVVAAWAHVDGGRLLVVRPHQVEAYFVPGGLVGAGETLAEAAAREAREEIGVHIHPADLRPAVVITAPAHGRPGVTVVMAVHVGPFRGVIEPLDEIAEIGWISGSPQDVSRCAIAVQHVAEHFIRTGDVTAAS